VRSAPPVVSAPSTALVISVSALWMPSPETLPLAASARSASFEVTTWLLMAVASPLPAVAPLPLTLPELAPAAASTVVTSAAVVVGPCLPVAAAEPVALTAVPRFVIVLVMAAALLPAEDPPSFAPPVLIAVSRVFETAVLAVSPVPAALPDAALAAEADVALTV
jgi:hypothetical protein